MIINLLPHAVALFVHLEYSRNCRIGLKYFSKKVPLIFLFEIKTLTLQPNKYKINNRISLESLSTY